MSNTPTVIAGLPKALLIRSRDAAAMIGIGDQGLCKWRREGRGPRPVYPSGPGGRPYYVKAEVEDWVAHQVAQRDGKAA